MLSSVRNNSFEAENAKKKTLGISTFNCTDTNDFAAQDRAIDRMYPGNNNPKSVEKLQRCMHAASLHVGSNK